MLNDHMTIVMYLLTRAMLPVRMAMGNASAHTKPLESQGLMAFCGKQLAFRITFLNPLMILNCWMFCSRHRNGYSRWMFSFWWDHLPTFLNFSRSKKTNHQFAIKFYHLGSSPNHIPSHCRTHVESVELLFHSIAEQDIKTKMYLYDQQTVVISSKTKREGQREVQAKKTIRTPWSVVNINSWKGVGQLLSLLRPCKTPRLTKAMTGWGTAHETLLSRLRVVPPSNLLHHLKDHLRWTDALRSLGNSSGDLFLCFEWF